MTYLIRQLSDSDIYQWRKLWQLYLGFYKTELPDEQIDTTWQRLMIPRVDPRGLVAVKDDGALVGLAHYLYHASCWTPGPYCYLQDLYVDRPMRGQGVGHALMDAVMEAAMESGADDIISADDGSIEVLTQPDDFTAVKDALEQANLTPESAEVTMRASTGSELGLDEATKMVKLLEMLEDCDDVQNVYSNADISEEILAQLAG